jgi:hypothetical protein
MLHNQVLQILLSLPIKSDPNFYGLSFQFLKIAFTNKVGIGFLHLRAKIKRKKVYEDQYIYDS